MFKTPIITTLAVAMTMLSSTALYAAEDAAAPAIVNTTCPMDGKEIVDPAKAPTVLVTIGDGADACKVRLALCSDACVVEFKKDPAKAMKGYLGGKGAPGPKTNFK